MGSTEGRRPRGDARSRKGYNIEMDLKEIRWETVEWIHVSPVKVAMKLLI